MAEAENKRPRRTPQEKANELDEKITKINQSILFIDIDIDLKVQEGHGSKISFGAMPFLLFWQEICS